MLTEENIRDRLYSFARDVLNEYDDDEKAWAVYCNETTAWHQAAPEEWGDSIAYSNIASDAFQRAKAAKRP
jgi:hypothetical protein